MQANCKSLSRCDKLNQLFFGHSRTRARAAAVSQSLVPVTVMASSGPVHLLAAAHDHGARRDVPRQPLDRGPDRGSDRASHRASERDAHRASARAGRLQNAESAKQLRLGVLLLPLIQKIIKMAASRAPLLLVALLV